MFENGKFTKFNDRTCLKRNKSFVQGRANNFKKVYTTHCTTD